MDKKIGLRNHGRSSPAATPTDGGYSSISELYIEYATHCASM